MVTKTIIKDVESYNKFISKFKSNKPHSFDTETTSEAIREYRRTHGLSSTLPKTIDLQALNYYYLEMEGMSLYDGENACYIDFENNAGLLDSLLPQLKVLFETSTGSIIAHNIAFDMKVLKKYGISLENRKIYCTMVADHLLDEEREHGLKKLAKELLGQEETIKYIDARRAGEDVFADYALNDAIWTYDLCMWQQPKMREEGVVSVFRDIEMPFQHCIVDMESNGVLLDMVKRDELYDKCNERKNMLISELLSILNITPQLQVDLSGNVNLISPVNFNSTQQLCDILFNQRKLKPIEKTATGKQSVGKKTLFEYKDKDEFVGKLYQYKVMEKLINGFLEPLPRFVCGDGRVRPYFRDTGTKTGRLSSNNFNYQQLPRNNKEIGVNIRDMFVVENGEKMIVSDFSGQELRVAAEVSKDKTLVDLLHKGYDTHLAIAKQFKNLDIPEEALSEKHPDYEMYKKKYKDERTQSKVITFGLLFGKEAYGFSKDFNVSEEDAQKIVDDYFNGMPQLKEAIEDAKNTVIAKGSVRNLFGRVRHFKKIERNGWEGYSNKSFRQAFNFRVQGSASDMMRLAMINVYKLKNKYPLANLKILFTTHDELGVSCKKDFVDIIYKEVENAMVTSVNFCVPIVCETEIGDSYGQAK